MNLHGKSLVAGRWSGDSRETVRAVSPLNRAPLEPPFHLAGEAQVDAAMTRLLAGHGGTWVIFSESWLWDSRGLVRSWLDGHARPVESAHFVLVDVYHYDLSGQPR